VVIKTNENGFFDAGHDLTTSTGSVRRLIVTIDRRVGLTYPPALPKWEGGWSVDGGDGFPSQSFVSW